MEQHISGFEHREQSQLEVVERLVATIGAEAFEVEVKRLTALQKVDIDAPMQIIMRCPHHPPVEMSDVLFCVLSRACDQIINLEPRLINLPAYGCRDSQRTALPQRLWLDLVRYAREKFDPAALDAEFIATRLKDGLSSREAFDALIDLKRSRGGQANYV
ncbi:hypothetical protein [Pseudomonas vlassakiae]|uniref:Uncharacterized protein n=1 Tax=Pseudomonas vlassakiae TaxID=485888 RepID=A0A923GEV2_9PSED|nr:hypothetical protein [Pseudomonas vlassakiae]MBV4540083.1 hypothetical protein [Pseudomonas vlassakiae]